MSRVAERIAVQVRTRDNWKSNGPGRSYNAFEYDAVITMVNVDPFFMEKLVAWMRSQGADVAENDLRALPPMPPLLPPPPEPLDISLPEDEDDTNTER